MNTETISINDSRFPTSNTKVAAAFLTIGFLLKGGHGSSDKAGIINSYDDPRKVPKVPKNHPNWKPGEVTYCLENNSETFQYVDWRLALKAWDEAFDLEKSADAVRKKLCLKLIEVNAGPDIIEEKDANGNTAKTPKVVRIAALATELMRLQPLEYIAVLRKGFENRERLVKAIRNPFPDIVFKKGEIGFRAINRTASPETFKKFST